MRKNKLFLVVMILSFLTLLFSICTFVYYISHQEELVKSSIQEELSKYQVNTEDISVDDSKVLLAIVRYCEANDKCKGPQGLAGIGIIGPQGLQGPQGESIQGKDGISIKGDKGDKGDQGESIQGPPGIPGTPAPKTERRCNAEEHRIEWRNEGDEAWQTEYYLSPLQSCNGELF